MRAITTSFLLAGLCLALSGNAAAETGQIRYDGCLANHAYDNCEVVPGGALRGASAVAVSPDGRSVYVVSLTSNSVAHLRRNVPDAKIVFDSCLANDTGQGCTSLPDDPLTGAQAMAVSPDGRSVYVGSQEGIAQFSRDTSTGRLTWDGCLANTASQGCTALPNPALTGPLAMAVSPDAKSVYVTADNGDSIAHFARDTATGRLTYRYCIGNDASRGCEDAPGKSLDGPSSVSVSPDGRSLYVTGSDSISHLFRSDPDGVLIWDTCHANNATQGCADLPRDPLKLASSVAVSPDGRSVYVASSLSGSVAYFAREAPPAPEVPPSDTPPSSGDPPPDTSPPPADTLAPSISGLALTNRRFRVGRSATAVTARRRPVGTTFRYTLSEPAAITVAIEHALPGRRVGADCRKPSRRLKKRPRCTRYVSAGRALTRAGNEGLNTLAFSGRVGSRKLRPGAYRAGFTATDVGGNRSSAATLHFSIVRR